MKKVFLLIFIFLLTISLNACGKEAAITFNTESSNEEFASEEEIGVGSYTDPTEYYKLIEEKIKEVDEDYIPTINDFLVYLDLEDIFGEVKFEANNMLITLLKKYEDEAEDIYNNLEDNLSSVESLSDMGIYFGTKELEDTLEEIQSYSNVGQDLWRLACEKTFEVWIEYFQDININVKETSKTEINEYFNFTRNPWVSYYQDQGYQDKADEIEDKLYDVLNSI